MREINFEKLTKRAIAIYAKERAALVSGEKRMLEAVETMKADLLKDMGAAEALLGRTATSQEARNSREQLASLQGIIARRVSENRQLAKANTASDSVHWHTT